MATQVTPSKQVRDVTALASRHRRVACNIRADIVSSVGCFLPRKPQDDRLPRQETRLRVGWQGEHRVVKAYRRAC